MNTALSSDIEILHNLNFSSNDFFSFMKIAFMLLMFFSSIINSLLISENILLIKVSLNLGFRDDTFSPCPGAYSNSLVLSLYAFISVFFKHASLLTKIVSWNLFYTSTLGPLSCLITFFLGSFSKVALNKLSLAANL